jgi:hypothetical protein
VLLGGFASGVAAALTHHFVYRHFDGEKVTVYNQRNLHIVGQVLARLVTLCLTLGAAFSYRQYVWFQVRRKFFPISALDNLFAVDRSITVLFSGGKTWVYATVAMLLASFMWAIQIPSFITPGTLTTVLSTNSQNATINAPYPKICLFDGRSTNDQIDTDCYTVYSTDTDTISPGFYRTVIGTEISSEIPQITSPCLHQNCTYTLQYNAPTLRCSAAPITAIPSNISDLSFYTSEHASEIAVLGWIGVTNFNPSTTNSGIPNPFPSSSEIYEDNHPELGSFVLNVTAFRSAHPLVYESATCSFWNTSMLFKFDFPDSGVGQVITHLQSNYLNNLADPAYGYGDGVGTPDAAVQAYWDIMVTPLKGYVALFNISGGYSDAMNEIAGLSPSAVRLTSLRKYIYTEKDLVELGYDPNAPGNLSDALTELSRNVSLALTNL